MNRVLGVCDYSSLNTPIKREHKSYQEMKINPIAYNLMIKEMIIVIAEIVQMISVLFLYVHS